MTFFITYVIILSMSDLLNVTEKQSTEELVQSYYDRALKYVLEQNKKLSKLALDTNVAGGFVETTFTRGIARKDFATPLAQTITAEEMANDGYFSQILFMFTALCSEVKTELVFKSKDLMDDPLHKKIFDFVNIQLDSIGGYETLFEKVIKPSLKWGTGIGQTVMRPYKFRGKTYAGLEDIKTVNLMNVMQFIFEAEDPSRLDSLRFLTFPKMINTELSNMAENNLQSSDTTETTVKTISIKDNCTAVTAHNAIDGNPLGTPYLYFLYPIWKTYKAMLEGTYNAMISFGTYPIAVKRNAAESGVDPISWENAESAKLQEIIALGGAPYISAEGEMYKLDPPDVEKLLTAQQTMYDIATRASGLGQITMGIQGGGSKNLMESIDILTDKHIKATVKSALADISQTLIRNLVRINFKREWNVGRILETPVLRIKDTQENDIMTSNLQDTDNKENKSGSNISTKVKQSKTKENTAKNDKTKTMLEKIKETVKKIYGEVISIR